jgi:hypothetical protein
MRGSSVRDAARADAGAAPIAAVTDRAESARGGPGTADHTPDDQQERRWRLLVLDEGSVRALESTSPTGTDLDAPLRRAEAIRRREGRVPH